MADAPAATHSLQVLHDHARRERDEAQAFVQQMEQQVRAAEEQASQLQQYRSDTQAKMTRQFSHGAGGGGIELMHSYRGFLARLEMAIGQQDRTVEQMRQRVQAARALLLEREKRLAAIDKLIERRARQRASADERREQRRLDEMAQRWRGPAALRGNPSTTY